MYFTPKRPIKSFQDLEVYQKLLGVSVAVGRRLGIGDKGDEGNGSATAVCNIGTGAVNLALDLPIKVATAHSLRFTDKVKAIALLEEIMLGCNILIVYLEQYRDICNIKIQSSKFKVRNYPTKFSSEKISGAGNSKDNNHDSVSNLSIMEGGETPEVTNIENEFFEQQIAVLTTCRWKVMHLARSWEKFDNQVKS